MTVQTEKKDWSIEVEKVIRDEFGVAIWARLKYFKADELGGKNLYHDLVFMPDCKGWVFIKHRISGNFVPDKRYHRLAVQASAIFSGKSC